MPSCSLSRSLLLFFFVLFSFSNLFFYLFLVVPVSLSLFVSFLSSLYLFWSPGLVFSYPPSVCLLLSSSCFLAFSLSLLFSFSLSLFPYFSVSLCQQTVCLTYAHAHAHAHAHWTTICNVRFITLPQHCLVRPQWQHLTEQRGQGWKFQSTLQFRYHSNTPVNSRIEPRPARVHYRCASATQCVAKAQHKRNTLL